MLAFTYQVISVYMHCMSYPVIIINQSIYINLSDFMLVGEEMAQKTFVTLFRSSCPFASTSQTTLQSVIDDQTYANVLSQYSIRDWAHLLALSDSSRLACAWLRALPSPKLGLTLSPAEFVVAVRLWLGIPVFSEADSVLCSYHQLVDHFGDHLLGCSHGPAS